MNYFYDLPIEIQCNVYERCGKVEWNKNILSVNEQVRNKKNEEFAKVLFSSRLNVDDLWKLRKCWD
jgi:hypothetical protein